MFQNEGMGQFQGYRGHMQGYNQGNELMPPQDGSKPVHFMNQFGYGTGEEQIQDRYRDSDRYETRKRVGSKDVSFASINSKCKKRKEKKTVTHRPKSTTWEEFLDPEKLEEIRAVKDDVNYLEKELSLIFNNFRKVQPFYKMKNRIPISEHRTAKRDSSKDEKPIKEAPDKKETGSVAKTNKYVKTFLDKYGDYGPISSQNRNVPSTALQNDELFSQTVPKANKERIPVRTAPKAKPKKERHQLADTLSFDGTSQNNLPGHGTTQEIDFDSNMNSLKNSELSRTSMTSKRREEFENFKKNYFAENQRKDLPTEEKYQKFIRRESARKPFY